jgi:F0F1-type ATP synthase epsilon subunit
LTCKTKIFRKTINVSKAKKKKWKAEERMKQKRKKQGKQEGKSQFYKNAASQVLYGHNAI